MRPLLLACLFLVTAGCDHPPEPTPVEKPVYVPPPPRVVAAKMEKVESHTEINWWGTMTRKGIHTQQAVDTIYYIVFTDGTSTTVTMERYAVLKVGDTFR